MALQVAAFPKANADAIPWLIGTYTLAESIRPCNRLRNHRMKYIHKSVTSYVQYRPTSGNPSFILGQSDKGLPVTFSADRFYGSENGEISGGLVNFQSPILKKFGEKIRESNPVSLGFNIHESDDGIDGSHASIYCLGASKNSHGEYVFDAPMVHINLDANELQMFIHEVENKHSWNDLILTVFFDEKMVLQSWIEAEKDNFKQVVLNSFDFCFAFEK